VTSTFKPGVYERLKADRATHKAAIAAAEALPGVARVFRSEEDRPGGRAHVERSPDPRRGAQLLLPDAAAT
jgi:hypothetical protein